MTHIKSKHSALLSDGDFIKQFLYFMELLVNNYEASESWNDVTTLNNYKNLDGDLHLSWHRYGYKTLLDMLLVTTCCFYKAPVIDGIINAMK